jgi:hypothetical protein
VSSPDYHWLSLSHPVLSMYSIVSCITSGSPSIVPIIYILSIKTKRSEFKMLYYGNFHINVKSLFQKRPDIHDYKYVLAMRGGLCLKQKHGSNTGTITHRTLWTKSLSTSIQTGTHAILQLRICQGNRRTLPTRVPFIL